MMMLCDESGVPVRAMHPTVDAAAFSASVARCCDPRDPGSRFCDIRRDVDLVVGMCSPMGHPQTAQIALLHRHLPHLYFNPSRGIASIIVMIVTTRHSYNSVCL